MGNSAGPERPGVPESAPQWGSATAWERTRPSSYLGGQALEAGVNLTELHILADAGESNWQVWANTLQQVFAGILAYEQIMLLATNPELREIFLRLLNQARQDGVNGTIREAWETANAILQQHQTSMNAAGGGGGEGFGETPSNPGAFTTLGNMLQATESGVLIAGENQEDRIRRGYFNIDVLPGDKRYEILRRALGGILSITQISQLANNVHLSNIFLELWGNQNQYGLKEQDYDQGEYPAQVLELALRIEAQHLGGTAQQDVQSYLGVENAQPRVMSDTTMTPSEDGLIVFRGWEDDLERYEDTEENLDTLQRFQLATNTPLRQGYEYLGDNNVWPNEITDNAQLRFQLAQRAAQPHHVQDINERKLAQQEGWNYRPLDGFEQMQMNRQNVRDQVTLWESTKLQEIWTDEDNDDEPMAGLVIHVQATTAGGKVTIVLEVTGLEDAPTPENPQEYSGFDSLSIFAESESDTEEVVWTGEWEQDDNAVILWGDREWRVPQRCTKVAARVKVQGNAKGMVKVTVLKGGRELGSYLFRLN